MSDPIYPVWCRRHRKTVMVLNTPAAVAAARLEGMCRRREEKLHTLGYDDPTDEERARNQFVNVDLPLHLPRGEA